MLDAAPQQYLGAREFAKFLGECVHQFILIVGSPVGEDSFQVIPYALVRIEFRGIGREELQVQTGKTIAEVTQRLPFVDGAVVQQDDDVTSKVPQQSPQEDTNLFLLDVRLEKETIQAEAATRGAHRHAGDGGDLVVAVAIAAHRRLAARRPRLANVGDQQEPRFVDEDEIGAQPRGVFFIRGHS